MGKGDLEAHQIEHITALPTDANVSWLYTGGRIVKLKNERGVVILGEA